MRSGGVSSGKNGMHEVRPSKSAAERAISKLQPQNPQAEHNAPGAVFGAPHRLHEYFSAVGSFETTGARWNRIGGVVVFRRMAAITTAISTAKNSRFSFTRYASNSRCIVSSASSASSVSRKYSMVNSCGTPVADEISRQRRSTLTHVKPILSNLGIFGLLSTYI